MADYLTAAENQKIAQLMNQALSKKTVDEKAPLYAKVVDIKRKAAWRENVAALDLKDLKSKNGQPFVIDPIPKLANCQRAVVRAYDKEKEIQLGVVEEVAYKCQSIKGGDEDNTCGWVKTSRTFDLIEKDKKGFIIRCFVCQKVIGELKIAKKKEVTMNKIFLYGDWNDKGTDIKQTAEEKKRIEQIKEELGEILPTVSKIRQELSQIDRIAVIRQGIAALKLEYLKSESGAPFQEIKDNRYKRAVSYLSDQTTIGEEAYYCPVDQWWIKGIPNSKPYDEIGPLSGSSGSRYYCKFCNGRVGEFQAMTS